MPCPPGNECFSVCRGSFQILCASYTFAAWGSSSLNDVMNGPAQPDRQFVSNLREASIEFQ